MRQQGNHPFRMILMILTALLALWFALPIFTGIVGVGSLLPLAVLTVFFFVLWKWESVCQWIQKTWKRVSGKIFLLASGTVITAAAVTFCTISGWMISAFSSTPQGETVIVLGAKAVNGEPMRMLANRLDAAMEYLNGHPEAVCIVTGGKGKDETEAEAVSMKRYLLRHGIAEERIFIEDRASNTSENLRYSTEFIEQENLSKDVVIVTDEFHQYRAQYFGKMCGLKVSSQSSVTPWYLLPTYWVREIGAILKALLLGY